MCKDCNNDPYLAGLVIWFEIPKGRRWRYRTTELGEDGIERKVTIEDDRSVAFPGRCVGHHKGRVRARTKKDLFYLGEADVLAYQPRE